jgi:hypothetical protein
MMTDQTQFIQQESLYRGNHLPELPVEEPTQPPKPWYRQPQKIGLAVAAGLVSLLIIIILLWMVFANQTPEAEPTLVFPGREREPAAVTPLGRQLQQVQAELRRVDPAQDRLPFPPVILDIGLTEGN